MQQSQLFVNDEKNGGEISVNMVDADVRFFPNWLPDKLATAYFESLYHELSWSQEDITLFGKTHKTPRLQVWYGDTDAEYTYSGLKMKPLPWHSALLDIKARCEGITGSSFNSVLANLYRTGDDSMGFHADNEPELGDMPVIASVSLGATRNFDFTHNTTKQKVRIELTHGSLLIMQGNTQTHWKHGINKTKRVKMPRINLTYRLIK